MSIAFVGNDFWITLEVEYDESAFLPLNEGSILFAFLQNNDPADVPDPPTGWVEIPESPIDATPSSFFATMWGFYKILEAAETGIYNFDAGSSVGWRANFVEYSGADPADPIADVSSAQNGNATPILTLPSVTVERSNSRLILPTPNQISSAPTVDQFTLRSNGPVYVFDKAADAGVSGDVDVVSFNEVGTGWDLGFLIAVNPTVEAGVRFDCSTIDAQIN